VTECWKRVLGWPGYEVSDQGNARSVDRMVDGRYSLNGKQSTRFIAGKPLTPVPHKNGTPAVNLWRGNVCTQVPIRRLMLLAFVGPQPRGMDAVNIDGDTTNNDLGNLCWDWKMSDRRRRMVGLR
jgi:hypothetical protein